MITHLLRLIPVVCAGLLLAVVPASPASAVQLAGTIDVHTGPVAWDQSDARDPLLNGEIDAGYSLPRLLGLRPELFGEFGVSTAPLEGAAVRWDLGARLHTSGTAGGVWLGAAAGATGVRDFQRALTRLEGGVRRSLGPARINLWLSRTGFAAGMASLSQDSARDDTLSRKGVHEYTDLGSRVTFALRRYELDLSLTRRMGGEVNRRLGWEVSATWWMAPSIGLVGAAGRSLPQLGLVIPGRRYGTLGLRLALGSQPRGESGPRTGTDSHSEMGPAIALAGRRLTIRAAPARRAEVMGDFTDWKAEPLTPMGSGQWSLTRDLSPGVHHLNVRFDGGAWLVPSGALAVDDGFGGRVGMLVVR